MKKSVLSVLMIAVLFSGQAHSQTSAEGLTQSMQDILEAHMQATRGSVRIEDQLPWKEYKSDHFLLLTHPDSDLSERSLLRAAEKYYRQISELLGYTGLDSLWLWENRCRIYLYRDQAEFLERTGRPEWSSGFARVGRNEIVSFAGAPDFRDSVLPHEMTHLLFFDFMGENGKGIPLALEEGVAMLKEKSKEAAFDPFMQEVVARGLWLPFGTLFEVESVASLPHDKAGIFYAQAYSVTRFLLEQFGSRKFIQLNRSLRDGMNLTEALRRNYTQDLQDFSSMEEKWVDYVSKKNRTL